MRVCNIVGLEYSGIPALPPCLPAAPSISKAELKPANVSRPTGPSGTPFRNTARLPGAILPADPKAPNINFQCCYSDGLERQIPAELAVQSDGRIHSAGARRSSQGQCRLADRPRNAARRSVPDRSGVCTLWKRLRTLLRAPARPSRSRTRGPTPSDEFPEQSGRRYTNRTYAQIKRRHDAAMSILRQMYGVQSRVNYFSGESQGGRESLMAAAHYPADYDGVVASVPLTYITGMLFERANRLTSQAKPGGFIPRTKLPAIAAEVRRQCDALDGLEDGVINNYIACNRLLDPSVHPGCVCKIALRGRNGHRYRLPLRCANRHRQRISTRSSDSHSPWRTARTSIQERETGARTKRPQPGCSPAIHRTRKASTTPAPIFAP